MQNNFLVDIFDIIFPMKNPISIATANVYIKHAKKFLGWFIRYHSNEKCDAVYINSTSSIPLNRLSFNWIIPNKTKHSASILIDYILWLRTERQISKSYEANILRGLAKLLKFRFRHDSTSSSSPKDARTSESIVSMLKALSESIESKLLEAKVQMSAYLENAATQSILLKPVSRKVTRALEEIRKLSHVADNGWDDATKGQVIELTHMLEETVKVATRATR